MIGLFLRPDVTQVVYGIEKDGIVEILGKSFLPPVIDVLMKNDVLFLTNLFKEVVDAFGVSREEFYVSIPDDFVLMDCGSCDVAMGTEVEIKEEEKILTSWIADRLLQVDRQEYEVTRLSEYRYKNKRMVSGCAVEKSLVKSLVLAAKEAGQFIISIEAASLSYLRFLNQWDEEHCILEVFKDSASIISYSMVAGFLKFSIPEFTWEKIDKKDSVNLSITLKQIIGRHDFLAKSTFDEANTNTGIHVLSPYKEQLSSFPALKERLYKEKISCAYMYTDLSENEVLELMVPIGAILQPIEAVMNDAFVKVV